MSSDTNQKAAEILAGIFTTENLKAHIKRRMTDQEAGVTRHLDIFKPEWRRTAKSLERAIYGNFGVDPLHHDIGQAMDQMRLAGLLQPIAIGADRGIESVMDWNLLIEEGWEACLQRGTGELFAVPLARGIQNCIKLAYYDWKDENKERRDADEFDNPDLHKICAGSALRISRLLTDSTYNLAVAMSRDFFTCEKTGQYIHWDHGSILSPSLITYGDDRKPRPLAPYEAPPILRRAEIHIPSGVLLMVDCFRVPGFIEGLAALTNLPRGHSIRSDAGLEIRTRTTYEAAGVLRIHTKNCVPHVYGDKQGVMAVTWLNEDHDDLWTPEGQPVIDIKDRTLGRICCDLWDVMVADREIVLDIIMTGVEVTPAESRGNVTYPERREEAALMLDELIGDFCTRIEVEPGSRYTAYFSGTGDVEDFAAHMDFSDPRLPDLEQDWIEPYFLISAEPLEASPELFQKDEWVWPKRYSAASEPEMAP